MSSKLIIFIFVLITLILYIKYQDYENYLLDPFITISPQGDLNNRLEITLAYLYKANTENKKLRVIWIKDDDCPENFNNLFESINNIQFIYTDTIPDNQIDFITKFTPEINYIKYTYYKYLKPILSTITSIGEKIFQPFFSTKEDGMGFGLSICRSMVEIYQGNITWENIPGSGACFTISFPLVSAKL
jgi:hypothetical protein